MKRDPFLLAYYGTTPLWWAADLLWGVDVRAAGFDSIPHLKQVYYGLCLLCAFVMWKKPSIASLVALGECSVNIVSLILGVLGSYFKLAGSIGEGVFPANPLTPSLMTNFCLSGTIAVIAFYRMTGFRNPRYPGSA